MDNNILLDVKNLDVRFYIENEVSKALDKVSFDIKRGETLGIVGESGCGKSMTALSIMQLIPSPPGKIEGGEIIFDGEDLLKKSKKEMRKIRGKSISMIFQEPMTSLNPVYTIGNQISETLILHQKLSKQEARKKAIEMLELVNMPLAAQRFNEYPHQLSGGMRQRVMIAMALSCNPKLLICDEPTTALDVTIQAQILKLVNNLKKQLNMSVIMITHDLGVISEIADRVMVMYAGQIVEFCDERDVFTKPLHPYTEALLKSIPSLSEEKEELYMIKGMVPNLLKKHQGCLFAPRCEYAAELCRKEEPGMAEVGERKVKCWKYFDKWEAQR